MIPGNFDFVRAESLEHAVRLLGEEDTKALAGGHSLIPLLKQRLAQPARLVDISRLDDLRGITIEGSRARVGALTIHRDIALSEKLKQISTLLPEAAGEISDPQVRNRGTLGGNIAHADPASDLPAVTLALDADIHLAGPDGERTVKASGFFLGLMETDLAENELVTGISFGETDASAYLKYAHPASGYAVCGAAAVIDGSNVRLAFNGIAAVPYLAENVSETLSGTDLSDEAIDAAVSFLTVEEPLSDLHASGEYRVHLAKVYGARALRAARDRRK